MANFRKPQKKPAHTAPNFNLCGAAHIEYILVKSWKGDPIDTIDEYMWLSSVQLYNWTPKIDAISLGGDCFGERNLWFCQKREYNWQRVWLVNSFMYFTKILQFRSKRSGLMPVGEYLENLFRIRGKCGISTSLDSEISRIIIIFIIFIWQGLNSKIVSSKHLWSHPEVQETAFFGFS